MNGKVQHVEHLVFYGADMTAPNEAGDTPLHICARFNQEECARVLLFRGADKTIKNNSARDALQVAHMSGHSTLEDIIQSFRPEEVVLFQELPTYNEKRRGTISAATLRNLQRSRSNPQLNLLFDSHTGLANGGSSSLSSAFQYHSSGFLAGRRNDPGRPVLQKDTGQNGVLISSKASIKTENDRVPRTVVVHKDQNGFGFILRGAKSRPGCPSILDFVPTPDFPSLQYFDIVEKNSMAEKAGLRCGDFLLEVCGVSVVNATHEHAVQLIKNAGEVLILKVIAGRRTEPGGKGLVEEVHNTNSTFKPANGSVGSMSSRSGMTSSRSVQDGLEELERLDATLDSYDRDGLRTQQASITKLLPTLNAAEPAVIASGSNATTYVAKVEMHEVPVIVSRTGASTDSLQRYSQSADRLNNIGKIHDRFTTDEPPPDYEEDDAFCMQSEIAPVISLPRPQPIMAPPMAPPLPASVIMALKQDSPQNSLRATVQQPPRVVDELSKQRDEAHAALVAAVMRRRHLLDSVDGELIADSIENRVQRSKMLQTVYRADHSTPEVRQSGVAVPNAAQVGLFADGQKPPNNTVASNKDGGVAAADFIAEAEKVRLEFLQKSHSAEPSEQSANTTATNKAKQPPMKPVRTQPVKYYGPAVTESYSVTNSTSQGITVRKQTIPEQGNPTTSSGGKAHQLPEVNKVLPAQGYNHSFVTYMREDSTKTHNTDHKNGIECNDNYPKTFLSLRAGSDVGESVTESCMVADNGCSTGNTVDSLKVVTDDTLSVLSSLSTLSTNSSVGVDAAQSSHGSPSHSSGGDSGYAKSAGQPEADQPIIPPPVEFASDSSENYPFVVDSVAVTAVASNLRTVVKPQSHSMVFPARARVSQK
jgi:hypothetical protein